MERIFNVELLDDLTADSPVQGFRLLRRQIIDHLISSDQSRNSTQTTKRLLEVPTLYLQAESLLILGLKIFQHTAL
jgi:hypothetical protein